MAKEETRKKMGEAMLLKDEWQSARRERASFEAEATALRTKEMFAELEAGRDRDIRKGSRAAHREAASSFREVLAFLEKRWVDKKKEMSAKIQLHEVIANLDLLNEIKNEGLVVDEEIVRLKEMEKDCEAIASLDAVPEWSVAGDAPQSMDQYMEPPKHGDQDVLNNSTEVRPSDHTNQTNQAVYRIDPRTSEMEFRLEPRSNDRTDRTRARLSRPSRHSKDNS